MPTCFCPVRTRRAYTVACGRLPPSHAPEMVAPTFSSTPASDMYEFGWLLWELALDCVELPPFKERPIAIPERFPPAMCVFIVDAW